jgi:hypothetical protein
MCMGTQGVEFHGHAGMYQKWGDYHICKRDRRVRQVAQRDEMRRAICLSVICGSAEI